MSYVEDRIIYYFVLFFESPCTRTYFDSPSTYVAYHGLGTQGFNMYNLKDVLNKRCRVGLFIKQGFLKIYDLII